MHVGHMHGIIKVSCVVRIDGKHRHRAQILTSAQITLWKVDGNLVRFLKDGIRKSDWKIMLPDNRQDIDPRLLCPAKDLDN